MVNAHPADTHLYYSTNTWVKWHIQKKYRADTHHVWCSPYFAPETLGAGHAGSLIPPTSSPLRIYRDLEAINRGPFDAHNAKVVSQKSSLISLTEKWLANGEIGDDEARDIYYLLKSPETRIWRPLIYLIPKSLISPDRVLQVPPEKRAGIGEEFIIEDLKGSEFEVMWFDG